MLKLFRPSETEEQFYRENDFSNILEYYMERSLIKAISKCKEESLKLNPEKDKEVREKKEQRKN